MANYRLYGFRADNHIQDVVEAICSDDSGALEEAAALTSRFVKVEVWQQARMVGRLVKDGVAGSTSEPVTVSGWADEEAYPPVLRDGPTARLGLRA
jgi:hypothetical protein